MVLSIPFISRSMFRTCILQNSQIQPVRWIRWISKATTLQMSKVSCQSKQDEGSESKFDRDDTIVKSSRAIERSRRKIIKITGTCESCSKQNVKINAADAVCVCMLCVYVRVYDVAGNTLAVLRRDR